MTEPAHQFTLELGGRTVDGVWDRLRRYVGLEWSGGPPETWAYRYYDAIDTDERVVGPVDVLTTAALHPGLSRADLAYFHDHAAELSDWLAELPNDVMLRDAGDATVEYLSRLTTWTNAPSLTLLSKVLHRKRPLLIPLVDRHVLDWYRPVTGERTATRAWPLLLRALRDDLTEMNALLLAIMNGMLEKELGRQLSHVRLADIIVWMEHRQ
jgi:hypothetical protein